MQSVRPIRTLCVELILGYHSAHDSIIHPKAVGKSARTQGRISRATFDASFNAMSTSPPLPIPFTPLVGRTVEVIEIDDLLRQPAVRLVTITGPGGVGKTRLALHVANGLRDEFPDGIWLVRLEAIREVELVLATIAQAVGIADTSSSDLADLLAGWLGPGAHLFVIDNFEQVAEASPVLVYLLERCPGLKLLVTSRMSLDIYGEREYPLGPLPMPVSIDGASISDLLGYSAIKLFVDRAAEVKPSFALTTANAADVFAICQRLDGLALAIELAAARIKVLTPPALLERLANSLRVLTSGARNLPERQQTMRGAIAWSYELLKPEDQLIFRLLSVFSGGFTLEALEAVMAHLAADPKSEIDATECDADLLLERISDLVDQSLVRRTDSDEDMPRFDLFQTIQEYAADQLEEHGESHAVKVAHAEYLVALGERAEPELVGPDQTRWFDLLEAEHDNIRAALAFAIQAREVHLAQRIPAPLWRFWWIRGHWTEGRRWLKQILDMSGPEMNRAYAYCLRAAAALAEDQGDYDECMPLYQRALDASRLLGDRSLEGYVVSAIANTWHDRGSYDEALRLHNEALALFEEVGDRRGIASCYNNIATVSFYRRDYPTAEQGYKQAQELLTEIGDYRGAGMALGNLGAVLFSQGRYEPARDAHEQSIAAMRRIGDETGVANELSNLGNTYQALGDFDKALELNKQALEIHTRLGAQRNASFARAALGAIMRDQGDLPAATDWFVEALQTFAACGDISSSANVLGSLAEMAHSFGDSERGARLFGAAQAQLDSIGTARGPEELEDYERILGVVRDALSAEAFAAEWAKGESLTLALAVADASEVQRLARSRPGSARDEEIAAATGLNTRDLEVLRLFVAGRSNQEIADALDRSLQSATSHVGRLYTRIGVDSRAGVTAFAFKHGLV
jgi:predicted ATPase/DNA-binding CsgD family transcriptional regulator/Tfp pilus assembly protein PilF